MSSIRAAPVKKKNLCRRKEESISSESTEAAPVKKKNLFPRESTGAADFIGFCGRRYVLWKYWSSPFQEEKNLCPCKVLENPCQEEEFMSWES